MEHGQESEEAIYFEEALPEVDVCEDDDIAFTNMFKSESKRILHQPRLQ